MNRQVEAYLKGINNLPITEESKLSIANQVNDICFIYNKYDGLFTNEFVEYENDILKTITQVLKDIKYDFDFDEKGFIKQRLSASKRAEYIKQVSKQAKKTVIDQRKSFTKNQSNFVKEKYRITKNTYNGDKKNYRIREEDLNAIINTQIKNRSYLERFTHNKDLLMKNIKLKFVKFFQKEITFKKLITLCEQMLKQDYNRFRNLMTDMTAKMSEAVNKVFRTETGLTYLMRCAVMDGNECDECGELDGSVYLDWDAPELQFHIGCRCEYVYVDEDTFYTLKEEVN